MAETQPNTPFLGTGEGESPLAKAPDLDFTMRTMASDKSSLKETGGVEPLPYTPAAPAAPETPKEETVAIPQVDVGPILTSQTPKEVLAQTPVPPQTTVALPAKSSKGMFAAIVGVLTFAALGAVGYFFVYPQYMAQKNAEVPAGPTPEQTTQQQASNLLPKPAAVPATSTEQAVSADAASSTATSTPVAPSDPALLQKPHVSLFPVPADSVLEVKATGVTADVLKQALASSPVSAPIVKEVVAKNADGAAFSARTLASALFPSVFSADNAVLFEDDATLFTYVDKNGSWPGMVLKIAKPGDMAAASAAIAEFEKNNGFAGAYLSDVGTPTAWKDGKVNTMPARYVPMSVQGNSFMYVWFNDKVLISTNFAGAQAAAKKLGF